MTNKLVIVGWMGDMTAYLNISRDDALRRWYQSNPDMHDQLREKTDVKEFEFDDSFSVYDAWEADS